MTVEAGYLREFEKNLTYYFSELLEKPFSKPLWIYISLSHKCTYKCQMCGVVKILNGYELGAETVKKAFDEISLWGSDSTIVITGGEPFLRKDIFGIISHAAEKGLKIEVVSNGVLINRDLAIKIVLSGLHNIAISLDDSKVRIVDIVALGEGEEILMDILERKEGKSSLEGCLGTVARENGRIINNGLRPLIENLDSITFPEFKDFPNKYKFKNRLPILGSRGCVHRCVFCDDTLMWRRFRFRSAQNVVKEMKLRKREGVEFLEFNDLLINGNLKQLSELSDLLIREKLNISWGGSATVDNRMDLKFLRKLKRAGCCYLNYGIESASPKVLREMSKSFTIEEAKKEIEDTYKAGISVCTNWIVGFPTETYEDFKEMLRFIKDNIRYLKNNIMVNSFILKGNSMLYHNQEKFGIVSDSRRNWYSLGGLNTVEERKRRYDEFVRLISELGDEPAHQTFQG